MLGLNESSCTPGSCQSLSSGIWYNSRIDGPTEYLSKKTRAGGAQARDEWGGASAHAAGHAVKRNSYVDRRIRSLYTLHIYSCPGLFGLASLVSPGLVLTRKARLVASSGFMTPLEVS